MISFNLDISTDVMRDVVFVKLNKNA